MSKYIYLVLTSPIFFVCVHFAELLVRRGVERCMSLPGFPFLLKKEHITFVFLRNKKKHITTHTTLLQYSTEEHEPLPLPNASSLTSSLRSHWLTEESVQLSPLGLGNFLEFAQPSLKKYRASSSTPHKQSYFCTFFYER